MLGIIALVAGCALGASNLSAAGRIGERHLDLTLDSVFWDDDAGLDTGLGASIDFNTPLAKSVDLSVGYAYLGSNFDGGGGDLNSSGGYLGATFWGEEQGGKFYARVLLAYVDAELLDGEAAWGVEIGAEFALGAKTAITPYVSYTDLFESGVDGAFDFGVALDFDLTNNLGLLLDVNFDDDSNFGASGGVVFRF